MHHLLCLLFAITVSITSVFALAKEKWSVSRMEDGRPSLQGDWTNWTLTPLERPASYGNRRALTREEALEIERKAQENLQAYARPVDLSTGAPEAGGVIRNEADRNFGVYTRRNTMAVVNGEYRTSAIIDPPDGRLPFKDRENLRDFRGRLRLERGFYYVKNQEGAFDHPELRNLTERCIQVGGPIGPLMVPSVSSPNFRIAQTPDFVVIHSEYMNSVRIIRIDGKFLPDTMREWMGDSIGYWEGDRLIVKSKNFKANHSTSQLLTSDKARLTERLERVAEDKLYYSFTLDDPVYYSRPWTAELPLTKMPPSENIYEYACHEGNYSFSGILAGARKQERDAQAKGL